MGSSAAGPEEVIGLFADVHRCLCPLSTPESHDTCLHNALASLFEMRTAEQPCLPLCARRHGNTPGAAGPGAHADAVPGVLAPRRPRHWRMHPGVLGRAPGAPQAAHQLLPGNFAGVECADACRSCTTAFMLLPVVALGAPALLFFIRRAVVEQLQMLAGWLI